jgi:hypothetical protein
MTVPPRWDVKINSSGVIEKRRVMQRPLPTRQKIYEAKIKGTRSEAVLPEHTLAVS